MRGLRRSYNPFTWDKREIRTILTVFYLIAVPIFVYLGFQPAEAVDQNIVGNLEINTINLNTPVAASELNNHELAVPDRIAGEYSINQHKTFLFGHSSTIFKNLKNINLGDEITYNNQKYTINHITTQKKSDINMANILAETEQETIVLMTCSGKPLGHDDYTHRLIVTATKI